MLQRTTEEASAESPNWPAQPEAMVQREPIEASAAAASGAAAQAFSPRSTAIEGISAGVSSLLSGGHRPEDMDELANKLYDRIRTRLKSELLVDRERAGFLTDLR
jgi:hypothetical protein